MLTQSFLKVPGSTTTAAYSDNSTPADPSDDKTGMVLLDGSGSVTIGVAPPSDGPGVVRIPLGVDNDEGRALTLLPDGGVLVAGRSLGAIGEINGFPTISYSGAMAVVNPNGSLRAGFGIDGKALTSVSSKATDLYAAVATSEHVLVAGEIGSGSPSELDFFVARFLLNGQPDSTFGTSGRVSVPVAAGGGFDSVRAIAVQQDAKILLAGNVNPTPGNTDIGLVRLTATGALDTNFGQGGKVITPLSSTHDGADAMLVQPDGSILVGGYENSSGSTRLALIKYTANGNLAADFGTGGKAVAPVSDSYGFAIALQGSKILVAGRTAGSSSGMLVVRYNADGSLDSTFGTAGKFESASGLSSRANALAVQSDGKIVLAGDSSAYRLETNSQTPDATVVRLTENGQLDTSFGASGKVVIPTTAYGSSASEVVVDSAGRITVGGSIGTSVAKYDFLAARLLPDGSLDPAFSRPSGEAVMPSNAQALVDAIKSAANPAQFARAVAAADAVMDVFFWSNRGAANIDGLAGDEPNVEAMLKYTAPTSSSATVVNFAAVSPSSGGGGAQSIVPVQLTQPFLKVPGSTTAPQQTDAYSNNNTPADPADDQSGRVALDGSG
ncbi:MAG: hypothetical protein FJ284_15695, partial [Planctomycetes bacterium]|nr:hypothetical protein [Planctomycetota bacterium]